MRSKGAIAAVILVFLLGVAGCGATSSYNSLVETEEQVNTAWSNLQAQYQRRADLIPNLVETVQGADLPIGDSAQDSESASGSGSEAEGVLAVGDGAQVVCGNVPVGNGVFGLIKVFEVRKPATDSLLVEIALFFATRGTPLFFTPHSVVAHVSVLALHSHSGA